MALVLAANTPLETYFLYRGHAIGICRAPLLGVNGGM